MNEFEGEFWRRQGSSPRPLITRFAPSPTGMLHLGHVLHMMYLWSLSKLLSAKIIFRLEDHDRHRCKEYFSECILQDLLWLGLSPDCGLEEGLVNPQNKQSNCKDRYLKNLEQLYRINRVYWCGCSRKAIIKRRKSTSCLIYDGECRDEGLNESLERSLRIKLSLTESFKWQNLDGQAMDACPGISYGDFTLLDRKRNYTYHYCAVSDDLAQGINLVIRGNDLVNSSAPQEALRGILSLSVNKTIYFHHPLLLANCGSVKLSKTQGSEPISSLREKGYSPHDVFGLAAYQLGIISKARPFRIEEMMNFIKKHAFDLA